MAIANLHETLLTYTLRKQALQSEIESLSSMKLLAAGSQADEQLLLSAKKREVRDYYKGMFDADPELQAEYKHYDDIPDFEEAIERVTEEYNAKLAELTAWEEQLDMQITTDSTEMEEIKAYEESLKSMLSSNIQSDFNYGLKQ